MYKKIAKQQQAVALRKKGFSLNEIHFKLGISKSSASLWTAKVSLSGQARWRLVQRKREGIEESRRIKQARTSAALAEAAEFARGTLGQLPKDTNHARLYCALLYWCEGEKSKNDQVLAFTNSDPALVSAYLRMLRKGFNIEESKFRVCVHVHPYHTIEKQLLFWSKITKIPVVQFSKPYRKRNGGKNVRDGYAGCASVRYYDVKVSRQVQAVARAFLYI